MIEQLYEAAILLAVGMLVVFTFLSLLIVGIHAITAFVRAFPGPRESVAVATNNAPSSVDQNQPSKEIIAAITAAVHKHRQSHK